MCAHPRRPPLTRARRLLLAVAAAAAARRPKTSARCASVRPRRVVIVTQRRSGSGFVVSMLGSHPSVEAGNELLSAAHQDHASTLRAWASRWPGNRSRTDALWREANMSPTRPWPANATGAPKATVFKYMVEPGKAVDGALLDEFERLCFGVVFLWRWNALRMYVSDKANHADRAASRKKKSTHDHQAHPQDAEALAFHQRHQIELLADARLKRHLLTILSSRREAADAWKERSRDSFSVYYEDLVAGAKLGNMMWTELQYFLGVWPRVLSTDLLPIHADIPLNYTVLNYAEVKVVLRHASKKELKKYLRPYDPEGHDATKLI